jgi:PKD repeat protein
MKKKGFFCRKILGGKKKMKKIKKITLAIELAALIIFSVFVISIIAGSLENRLPSAYATSNVRSGKTPLEVKFEGHAKDRDGNIVTYFWDFGDGGISDLQNPTHVYFKEGKYTVTFMVTDDDGATSKQYTLKIIVIENKPPEATASASRTEGEKPLKVEFTGEGKDPDGKIDSYFWDFGDGETSEEKNPTHTYQKSGTFMAKFIVTDDSGATDMVVFEINVGEESDFDYEKWYIYYYIYHWYGSPYYNPYPYNYGSPPWSSDNPYFWTRPIRATIISLSQR